VFKTLLNCCPPLFETSPHRCVLGIQGTWRAGGEVSNSGGCVLSPLSTTQSRPRFAPLFETPFQTETRFQTAVTVFEIEFLFLHVFRSRFHPVLHRCSKRRFVTETRTSPFVTETRTETQF
jgi:hypothetical protein